MTLTTYSFILESAVSASRRTYPADRCVWQTSQIPNRNGYEVHDVVFYTGATNATNAPVTIQLDDAELGYIGKSGRFVKITE